MAKAEKPFLVHLIAPRMGAETETKQAHSARHCIRADRRRTRTGYPLRLDLFLLQHHASEGMIRPETMMKKFAPPPLPACRGQGLKASVPLPPRCHDEPATPGAASRPSALLQRAAQPKLQAPPATVRTCPAALQMARKFRSTDISLHAPKLLTVAKAESSKIQEVQIMKLGTSGYISSNSKDHLSTTVGAIKKYNTYVDGDNKENNNLSDKFVKVRNTFNVKLREDFVEIKGDRHAEQNLVLKACLALKNAEKNKKLNTLNKTVMIYGSKPPCNVCRRVMFAFERALMIVYGMNLSYNRSIGDTSVSEENAGLLTGGAILDKVGGIDGVEIFERFINVYKQNLN